MESKFKTPEALSGEYFGYPECCISAFDERISLINEIGMAPTPLAETLGLFTHGTGFIPCDKCARELYNKSVTIDELLKNRVVDSKFPFEQPPGLTEQEGVDMMVDYVTKRAISEGHMEQWVREAFKDVYTIDKAVVTEYHAIFIFRGEGINRGTNPFRIGARIVDITYNKFPAIKEFVTDKDLFRLTLIPSRDGV